MDEGEFFGRCATGIETGGEEAVRIVHLAPIVDRVVDDAAKNRLRLAPCIP